MDREEIKQRYLNLLDDITDLVNNGQTSSETVIAKIQEYQTLKNILEDKLSNSEFTQTNNVPENIEEILSNILLNQYPSGNNAIDRQSFAVKIDRIDDTKTTLIKDEKISHTENGGLHSDIVKAIIISCEGKRIDANTAQGVCEITGKLAEKALSCHLCHRSICLRHCEFIEQNGENYPYCNTPIPGSKISCARKAYLSMNTWQEAKKKTNKEKTNGNSG